MRFAVFVVAVSLVVVPVVNLVFDDPPEDDLEGWVRAAISTDNPKRAKDALAGLIAREPLNPRYHFMYVKVHFDQSEGSGTEKRKDEQVYHEYHRRTKNADANMADIGHFGLALYCSEKKQYDEALMWIQKVRNRKLHYSNCLRAVIQKELKHYEQAEQSFRKEIESEGHVRWAVYGLALLLDEQHKHAELEKLYQDFKERDYFPGQTIRKLHLRKLRLGGYVWGLLLPIKRNVNVAGFLGAVLIVAVWLYFLKRLDIFEPEKNRYLLLTLFGGMLSPFAALFLYDILKFYFGFGISGQWINDLFFCIFGIGFVEELVKLIPFLLMVRFSRQVNESIDFLIYAAVSALGFSFMENLLYFDERSLFIMDQRGMICSIGHMFYTCLVGYGIILAKYRKKGTVTGNVLIFFLLACLIHGIYDFWLICEAVPRGFVLFSLLLKIVAVIIFNRMINNALNESEFFAKEQLHKLNHLRERLGISLIIIVLFEYVCLAWKYGPELTYAQFSRVIGLTWFLIFFLSFSLGHYIIRQDRWNPLFAKCRKPNGSKEEFIPS
jgi:RsiW-degrading membrane proteinase PrsW (M82 family)